MSRASNGRNYRNGKKRVRLFLSIKAALPSYSEWVIQLTARHPPAMASYSPETAYVSIIACIMAINRINLWSLVHDLLLRKLQTVPLAMMRTGPFSTRLRTICPFALLLTDVRLWIIGRGTAKIVKLEDTWVRSKSESSHETEDETR
jgi:hypothetical protein